MMSSLASAKSQPEPGRGRRKKTNLASEKFPSGLEREKQCQKKSNRSNELLLEWGWEWEWW